MYCYPSQVVETALLEVGYVEKATNNNLDDKTANSGNKNWNKYAKYIDSKYPTFYNGVKNGFDWCDIFVDYCFLVNFGLEETLRITCQPEHSLGAGCTYSCAYYASKGRFGKTPQIGSQIFFSADNGKSCFHTGIVYDVDNTYVYTVEGNTDNAVKKRVYKKDYQQIWGYGYPLYDIEQPVHYETLKVEFDVRKYNKLEVNIIGK